MAIPERSAMSSREWLPSREVEHPEEGELALAAGVVAADRAVEAAAAELRLALRGEVAEALACPRARRRRRVSAASEPARVSGGSGRGCRPRCGTRGSGRTACARSSPPAGRSRASCTGARRSRRGRSPRPRRLSPERASTRATARSIGASPLRDLLVVEGARDRPGRRATRPCRMPPRRSPRSSPAR